ncbi:MAG: hypothetical protein ISN28_10050 [Ectothiorhodospiraceae bacterium AqS1]|nr:hypothetical protein [Ectothiorhodospiraceae bacterium AqS1]
MDLSYKAHLIRATYEYCVGRGIRPMVAYLPLAKEDPLRRHADESGLVQLSLAPAAIRNLKIDDEQMAFATRFGGTVTQVSLAIGQVVAIQGAGTACGLRFAPAQLNGGDEAAKEGATAPPAKKKKAAKKRAEEKPKLRLL